MKRIFLLILLFTGMTLLLTNCSKYDNETVFYERKYKKQVVDANKVLKDYYMGALIPGISVAVSINGELVYSQGYGFADKELKTPVKRDTKFRIGTTSQIFTAILAGQLQEEGKLNLDSSIYNYLPKFPKKQWDFTPRMLGAHTVMFAPNKDSNFKNPNKLNTINDFIQNYDHDALVTEPNTSLEHSAYGMTLLGGVVEAVGKNSYKNLLSSKICTPLNLKNTQLDNPYLLVENRSKFYATDFVARLVNADMVNLTPYGPSAGILSTAEDLAIVGQQLLKPGFLSQETIDLFSTPHILNDGEVLNSSFGWLVNDKYTEDQAVIGQIGSVYGGASMIVVFPKDKIVVAMCTNKGNVMRELPVMKIAQAFREK